jgi:hypothetical protein
MSRGIHRGSSPPPVRQQNGPLIEIGCCASRVMLTVEASRPATAF